MPEDLDAKILKVVDEAEKGLTKLQADLTPLSKKLKELDVDKAKSLAAMKKVFAVMGKFTAVTKLQSSNAFAGLKPETQAQVTWMGGLVSELLKLSDRLHQNQKDAKMDPAKKRAYLVRVLKHDVRDTSQMPKLMQLVKQIEKGKDTGDFDDAMISFLPMAIMLWTIRDTIQRGLKARPK
jgi:hypothetical protein